MMKRIGMHAKPIMVSIGEDCRIPENTSATAPIASPIWNPESKDKLIIEAVTVVPSPSSACG